MTRTIDDAVREVCLWFPETQEIPSRGSPDFRVAGKTFATYVINHHGDGRVALWLRSPPGAQELYADSEPEHYFVPPYVGPRGWLGVDLNSGLKWPTIAERVREAYVTVAPKKLSETLDVTPKIKAPTKKLRPEDIDPLLAKRPQQILTKLRKICLGLPETSEITQFGSPAWRAGKKSFCGLHYHKQRLQLQVWVGSEMQSMLTFEADRYRIPAYMGHNGWINLDVEDDVDWREVEGLVMESYRHFALKRMLKALDGG